MIVGNAEMSNKRQHDDKLDKNDRSDNKDTGI